MDEETVKIGTIVVVFIVLLSGLVLVASGRLRNAFVINLADPDTVGLDDCAFNLASTGLQGFGSGADLGGDLRQRGEIFDRTVVWTSWFKDGVSIPFTGRGELHFCPGQLNPIDFVKGADYKFFINNGGGFKPIYQLKIPSGVLHLDASQVTTIGSVWKADPFALDLNGFSFCNVPIPSNGGCPTGQEETINDGAALKVVFAVTIGPGPTTISSRDFASDQVELLSAISQVSWSKDGYTVGDTAQVRWTIPIAKDQNGNPAYFLSVIDQNTNTAIIGYDRLPLATTSGSSSFQVAASMFSNVLATCQNRLRAQILSTLIVSSQQDASVAQTVDIGGPAPTVTSVTWDKPKYNEGDMATVSWSSSGNVSRYHLTVLINGLSLVDTDVPAGQTAFPNIRLARSGTAQAELTAYSLCQPSVVKRALATVGPFFGGLCIQYPTLPQCGPVSNWIAYLLAALAILGIIAALGLSLWLLGKIELIPGWISILISFLIAGGLAAYFISAGTLDVLIRGGG